MNLLNFLSRLFAALAHAEEAADTSTAQPAPSTVSTVDTQSALPLAGAGRCLTDTST